MKFHLARVLFIVSCQTICIGLLFFLSQKPILAALTSCSASVDPTTTNINTSNDFTFQVTNTTGDANMTWVRITRPSTDFTITGYNQIGASITMSEEQVTITGIDVGPSSSFGEGITATNNDNVSFSGGWVVEGSDDPDGAGAIACSGDLNATIYDSVNSEPPVLSDLTISNVSLSAVTISWTTNKATTSTIEYGLDANYGLTKTESSASTSHSVTINSLLTDTSYHYRITSLDNFDNTTQTSDNTFATAEESTVTTNTVTTVVTLAQKTTSSTSVFDNSAPLIYLTTAFDKPFSQTPLITGRATDNKGVQKVEYSVDNGKNWAPVDTVSKIGLSVNFSFSLSGFEDDNYQLKVRATDTSGNTTVTKTYALVIDNVKPSVGAIITSIGPQIVPSINGFIYGLTSLDQKVTLSSIGGTTAIDIVAGKSTFSLVKNLDNDLWSGIFSFTKPGTYPVEVKSVDGAGNKSSKKLNPIKILPAGIVSDGEKPLGGVNIKVFYLDQLTKKFILWDGSPYGQQNPQVTNKNGNYTLFLPPGTYYLAIESIGFKPLKSNIFAIDQSLPINDNFVLGRLDYINFGIFHIPLIDFSNETVKLSLPSQIEINQNTNINKVNNKQFPEITLNDGSSDMETSFLDGKQSVIALLNSWDPNSSLQLQILNKFDDSEWNKVAIFEQEQGSKIAILKSRGGYRFPMLADKNGELLRLLKIDSLPVQIIVNRKGVIQKIHYGLLSENEFYENLIH